MKFVTAMIWFVALALFGCVQSNVPTESAIPQPKEMVDLGALVTEDLPERVWGRAYLTDSGYLQPNSFKVMAWEQQHAGGALSGSNSYYTLFNHGGPHVDAPNHVGLNGGVDSYPIDVFSGPVKVFDASQFANGRTVGLEFFQGQDISPQDIVLIYTGYNPPADNKSYPSTVTITRAAAEYLASIPIRSYGTDAWSVYSFEDTRPVEADSLLGTVAPIHEVFLSRGIPIYEQLFNVDRLLGKKNMYFVGVPLNIKDGDGMIVRPVVFVY